MEMSMFHYSMDFLNNAQDLIPGNCSEDKKHSKKIIGSPQNFLWRTLSLWTHYSKKCGSRW